MRRRIFEIIELSDGNNRISSIYDTVMLLTIVTSLIPLTFKTSNMLLECFEEFCTAIFIVDYILRLVTADFRYNKKSVISFVRYPFSLMAIVDLISILPSFTLLNDGFRLLRVLRLVRTLRIFKFYRYSKNVRMIINVLKKSKESLIAVGTLAIAYILVSALIIFNVEPESFSNFFEAIYWATVSLTTVGYGDIYPITTTGRIITMFSSILGIAIVALPAGIITAGYMNEIDISNKSEKK